MRRGKELHERLAVQAVSQKGKGFSGSDCDGAGMVKQVTAREIPHIRGEQCLLLRQEINALVLCMPLDERGRSAQVMSLSKATKGEPSAKGTELDLAGALEFWGIAEEEVAGSRLMKLG